MPYYRRRYAPRRRRNYRRRPRYAKPSKGVQYANTAIKALSLAKYVAGLVNVERKTHTGNHNKTDILSGTGQVGYLTGIAVGDTDGTRDGNQVRFKSIQVKGGLIWNSTAASPQQIRLMLVQKKDTNGSDPTVTDILTAENPNGYYNKDEIFNYKVLIDKTYILSDQTPEIRINWFRKLSLISRWSGTTNAVSDHQRNGLFLVFLSDQATSNGPSTQLNSRVTYIDN